MLKILQEDSAQELRLTYMSDNLFRSLFPGLAELQRLYGELSPTEVWREALEYTNRLKSAKENIDIEVIQLFNDLLEKYLEFRYPDGEIEERSSDEALYTTICVLTCLNFRLVACPDEMDTEPRKVAVKRLLEKIGKHPVHAHLYLSQRRQETEMEDRDMLIPRVDYLRETPVRYGRRNTMTEGEIYSLFQQLFRKVDFAEVSGFIIEAEANMTFKHKIDRAAYLVFFAQKGWLKSPRTIKAATWVAFMNTLLGKGCNMQQSEVSRKFQEMKDEEWFDSFLNLTETYTFNRDNFAQSYFETMKENVREMHKLYNGMKKSRPKDENN